MNIGVADAIEMGEHWHPRIGLHPRHQALAAARNDHVDQPGRSQHRAHRSPVLRRYKLHGCFGHACRGQAAGQSRQNRAVGMHSLAAAAQQHGIARAQAQRGSVRRHIGSAFIDDSDQPDRHPHPRHAQPVGPLARIDDLTDRIGEVRDLLHRIGNPGQPRGIEPQPVEHCLAEAICLAGGKIERIGGKDFRLGRTHGGSGGAQGDGLGCVRHGGQHALRGAARLGEAVNHVFGSFDGEGLACHAGPVSRVAAIVTRLSLKPACESPPGRFFPPN